MRLLHRSSLRAASQTGPSASAHVAADAADAGAMARLAEGSAVIYNCVNPPYHRWPADWPPIAASLLAAAERSGAVLVTLSNLYGYGPAAPSPGSGGYDAAHPMTEATPLAATGPKGRARACVWQDARAAPSNAPRSQRQVVDDLARAAGAGHVRVSQIPSVVLRGLGLVSPLLRELRETEYQFRDDFVMDSSAAEATFGLKPTSWDEVVAVTIRGG